MTVDKELRRTVYHVGMQSLEAMPPSPPASPAKVAFPGAIALPSQLAPHQRAEQFVVWYLGAYGITPFYRPPPPLRLSIHCCICLFTKGRLPFAVPVCRRNVATVYIATNR